MQLLCSRSLDSDRGTTAGLSKIAHRRNDTQRYAIADGGHQTKEAKLCRIEQIRVVALIMVGHGTVGIESCPVAHLHQKFAMGNQSFANAETIDRLAEQLAWLLKTFHEERQRSGASRETEFWRGNFVGMKRALFAIYGEAVKEDVLGRLRQTTNLPIPHRGPLSTTGVPEGFDSDADF
jgi:hypothetical protein